MNDHTNGSPRHGLRNLAIIAHVDHGKTTLVDTMLQQANTFRANQEVRERVLDSMDLERERGITIMAKNAALRWQHEGREIKINIIDTPGHSDFGGEVERVLSMADGALLLVDAAEGDPADPFRASKALEAESRADFVINKIDRQDARPSAVLDEIYGLFIDLDASEEQLEFPVIYAIGREGIARTEPEGEGTDLRPLFDAIINTVPPPHADVDAPLQMLISNIDYNDFVGRIAIGRIVAGTIRSGQDVTLCKIDGSQQNFRVSQLFGFEGLQREQVKEAEAGDIVGLAGLEDINIGETVADAETRWRCRPSSWTSRRSR